MAQVCLSHTGTSTINTKSTPLHLTDILSVPKIHLNLIHFLCISTRVLLFNEVMFIICLMQSLKCVHSLFSPLLTFTYRWFIFLPFILLFSEFQLLLSYHYFEWTDRGRERKLIYLSIFGKFHFWFFFHIYADSTTQVNDFIAFMFIFSHCDWSLRYDYDLYNTKLQGNLFKFQSLWEALN